jgi:VWFA-related protein
MAMRKNLAWMTLLALAALAGREGVIRAAPPTPEFTSAITVSVLPVFVVDKDGKAVQGLAKEDFVIEDDGKVVEIAGFRSIDAADPENQEALKESPAARRHFMLLFDLSFTSIDGIVRSRKAAMEFVSKDLQPLDLAAVGTFSANQGLRFLIGFTSDRGQLMRAVETLGVFQRDRQVDPLGLAYDLRDLGSMAADTVRVRGDDTFDQAVRELQNRFQAGEENYYRERVMHLVEALGQLGKILDTFQGRKQVLFLSNGFDDSVLVGATNAQQVSQDSEAIIRGRSWEVPSTRRFGDSGVRDALTQALRTFSASDAVIHTVDLTGLRAGSDARYQDGQQRRGGRESLSDVAELSGGRFFRNANDLAPVLSEVSELSRHSYLIAFEPSSARSPGKFHKLKVRMKKKGLTVSHRSGYFERLPNDKKPAMARRFEAAEIITKGIEKDELPLRALALPYRPTGADVVLPVVLELEGPALIGAAAAPLELEVHGYAFDEQGTLKDVATLFSRVDPARAGARLREGGLQAHVTFRLQPGLHNLKFLVQDMASGRIGSKWLEVSVPSFEAGEVFLSPPLFMGPPDRGVVLEVRSRASQGLADSPFRADQAFVPEVQPSLVNGREHRVCVLAFDASKRYDPGATFELVPRLLNDAGQPVSVGPVALSQAQAGDDGLRRFVLTFTPEGLAAGPYTFRIGLRDPASGRVSEAYQSVRVQ